MIYVVNNVVAMKKGVTYFVPRTTQFTEILPNLDSRVALGIKNRSESKIGAVTKFLGQKPFVLFEKLRVSLWCQYYIDNTNIAEITNVADTTDIVDLTNTH